MREVSAFEFLDLRLGLLEGHCFRIVDQDRDDLHLVDVGIPQRLGQLRIASDRLGVLAEDGQADAIAFQRALIAHHPVLDAAGVLILLQIGEDG